MAYGRRTLVFSSEHLHSASRTEGIIPEFLPPGLSPSDSDNDFTRHYTTSEQALATSLARRLSDCRRRVAALETHNASEPIYTGLLSWEAIRCAANEPKVILDLVGQQCYFSSDFCPTNGNHSFFFYSGNEHPRGTVTYNSTRQQCHALSGVAAELASICDEMPDPVKIRLRLPESAPWWLTLHHLAWHFPSKNLLDARRRRLLRKAEYPSIRSDERFVQLFHEQPEDIHKGLIYSMGTRDAYAQTIAGIDLLSDTLTWQAEPPASTSELMFASLLTMFRASGQGVEHSLAGLMFMVIKCGDSFESPPARLWAGYTEGGCTARRAWLSALNADWEFAWFQGAFCEHAYQMSEQAGSHLPALLGWDTVMFSRIETVGQCTQAVCCPPAVVNRNHAARWVGHVLAILRRHRPELVEIKWCSPPTRDAPLYGYATLKVNFYEASALAIELSNLHGGRQLVLIESEEGTVHLVDEPRDQSAEKPKKTVRAKPGPKPLVRSDDEKDRLLANLYDNVLALKKEGVGPRTLADLANDQPHLIRQAEELGETLDEAFMRRALSYKTRRERNSDPNQ
jgi:hypothetical protein